MDVRSSLGQYTWDNRQVGKNHIATWLDRFLVSNDLLLGDLKFNLEILLFNDLDHNIIVVTIEDANNYGPIPFKFNPIWL